MSLPREVILDLLPLYLAGEASPATRALVEARLAEDPELAERVRALAREDAGGAAGAGPPPAPPPDLELAALRRTRALLVWQRWLFALGCTCVALLFSLRIAIEDGWPARVSFLAAEFPAALVVLLVVGAAAWIAYFRIGRRRR